jgi:hypothetical protein
LAVFRGETGEDTRSWGGSDLCRNFVDRRVWLNTHGFVISREKYNPPVTLLRLASFVSTKLASYPIPATAVS